MVAAIATARRTDMAHAMDRAMRGAAKAGRPCRRGAANAGGLVALLLLATAAMAQDGAPAQSDSPKTPAGPPPTISYEGGQLSINAPDSTLGAILKQVAALTGMKLDVPPGADSEQVTAVELGPGPARQVLASLLGDSSFDYVIQSSNTDRVSVQCVLLMARMPKGSGANGAEQAARPSRNPGTRALAAPEPSPANGSAAALPGNAPDAAALNPQPSEAQPDPPMPSAPSLAQPEPSGLPRPGALTPPATLDQQSISQQLTQMYQQRAQMMQQERQTGSPAPSANSGNK